MKITRRNLLQGAGKAALVAPVVALPVVGSLSPVQAHEDAQLIALWRKASDLKAESYRCSNKADALQRAHPEFDSDSIPYFVTTIRYGQDGEPRECRHRTEASIRRYYDDRIRSVFLTTGSQEKLRQECEATIADIARRQDAWVAGRERLGISGLHDRADTLCEAYCDIHEEIETTQAVGLVGLAIKLAVGISHLNPEGPDTYPERLLVSAQADAARLIGGLPS